MRRPPAELIVAWLVLFGALLPVVRAMAPRARGAARTGTLAAACLAVLAAAHLARPGPDLRRLAAAPREMPADGWVGSGACQSCHPREWASWQASHHRRMTAPATPEHVLGDFGGAAVRAGGRLYHLLREGDSFWAAMIHPQWTGGRGEPPLVRRRVVLVTGSHHEQDYWLETDRPRALAHLPVVWRVPERRWVPGASTFLRPPHDPDAHEVPEVGGWNRNCIQCHVTHGVPALDLPRGADTRVVELGVACEACHGPGGEHVAANRDPQRRWRRRRAEDADPTIVNPARLDPARAPMVCGQCHMLSTVGGPAQDPAWNRDGFAYRPGDDLAASRTIVRQPDVTRPGARGVPAGTPGLRAAHFWPDGAIRVAGREYHGLLESPCHRRGPLGCASCHRMHPDANDPRPLAAWAADQLGPGMDGDEACLQCHEGLRGRIAEHTRHRPGSAGSRCLDCHMPYTTYGLLKAIRSHTVASPDLARDRAAGRPNACNLCHLDRPLAWTAMHLHDGWGQPPPPLDEVEAKVAAVADWALRGDAGQRVLAAWALGWEPAIRTSAAADWRTAYLGLLLDDEYDAVRFVAQRALGEAAPTGYDFLAPPPVRAAAAAHLAGRRTASASPALLLGGDGRLDREAVGRLRAQRDERPVLLRE